ncbi:MAG: tRNA uridine-5-carboxymethylaminomethyl(34) synthesis GTPase MnmE [Alphaproteobacteria bacterium GM7ARS4]|nr:tRNA uridine-5-carboxymethylaminomethyl(34) synthesis GTPase MnmE [Alphaproteobacteria bacterium GM7ARS4]
MRETIFAQSSGGFPSGVSVVRLSGAQTEHIVRSLCGTLPPPRHARLCKICDPIQKDVIDIGLVLWFPAPKSFTGEDMAEFHVHGSMAVMDRLVALLCAQRHCRMAEAGEFTRRAFYAGKVDMTQAEAMADLIMARTERQRQWAMHQMRGGLYKRYEAWRERIMSVLAWSEASLDFAYDDLPASMTQRWIGHVESLIREVEKTIHDVRGVKMREGFRVSIHGAPNVGKSSVFNALLRDERAIVYHEAGTTRDVLEGAMDIQGYLVTLCDSAGIRDYESHVEAEGGRRSMEEVKKSDICLGIVSCDVRHAWQALSDVVNSYRDAHSDMHEGLHGTNDKVIVIVNKADIMDAGHHALWAEKARHFCAEHDLSSPLFISAKRDHDVLSVQGRIGEEIMKIHREDSAMTDVAWTRTRHRHHLEEVARHLRSALTHDDGVGSEMAAEDVRLALSSMGRIVGTVDVEAVLDRLFSTFCIGK